MVARVLTVAFEGIKAAAIDVQVQLTPGIPSIHIVGLPDKAVAESRERVRSALQSVGLDLPLQKIIINLSPADRQKEGSHYDLPIAVGLLIAMHVLPEDSVRDFFIMGELALDGRISPVPGCLPAAIEASSRNHSLICPEACGPEAAWARDLQVLAPNHLLSLINHLKGKYVLTPPEPKLQPQMTYQGGDFQEVKGQETAKRAFEIAAAGGHNLMMIGPPGAGKSMLASRLPSILPPLAPQEALEVTMIHSVAGKLEQSQLIHQRPYRDPHHSASLPALVGGSAKAKPGEISLAHHGVLFLDELPEFPRPVLEALRQPLETGTVSIARANAHITYPAQFQLIAALNPCRCGYLSDIHRQCRRAPLCGSDYQAKISGPLLDRFDIRLEINALKPNDLISIPQGEPSAAIAKRVLQARFVQHQRYQQMGKNTQFILNSQVDNQTLMAVTALDTPSQSLLTKACEKYHLSARAYHRLLKVARTIADLAGTDAIRSDHLAEALSFRQI